MGWDLLVCDIRVRDLLSCNHSATCFLKCFFFSLKLWDQKVNSFDMVPHTAKIRKMFILVWGNKKHSKHNSSFFAIIIKNWKIEN